MIQEHAIPGPSRERCDRVVPNIELWQDYWGVEYDKLTYPDRFFYACKETSVFATHTGVFANREVCFDVSTTRQSINLVCSSKETDCYYTHDGDTGRCMPLGGRQFFIIERRRIIYVINAKTIVTKNKLVSGQCVYHWWRGWSPYYKENVIVISVITFGRKIGDYYYYAIMNSSAHVSEFPCHPTGFRKREYTGDNVIASDNLMVAYHDTNDYGHNRTIRVLNSSFQVVGSWNTSRNDTYDPSDFTYFNMDNKFSAVIRSVPDDLARDIQNNSGIIGWFRKVESEIPPALLLDVPEESRCLPTLGFGDYTMLDVNSIRVRLALKTDPFALVKENLGELLLQVNTGNVIKVCSIVNHYLWMKGCQIITYCGDVSFLTSDGSTDPHALFSGACAVDTPCLFFACDSEGIAKQLKEWFVAEIDDAERNFVGVYGLTIHPDWGRGAAILRSNTNYDCTLSSLEKWRNIQAIEGDEVSLARSQVAAIVDSPEEICVSPLPSLSFFYRMVAAAAIVHGLIHHGSIAETDTNIYIL